MVSGLLFYCALWNSLFSIGCNGEYCEEARISMFAQRADMSVKPAGEITGGYIDSTYDIGDVLYQKMI